MEIATTHHAMPVSEASQPSAARYLARDLAETAGFNEQDGYRAGLVATELATNLVKHATGGEFLARISARAPDGEIELIAVDRGPGMTDVAASLVDGHSTAGSPGNGLGGIRRLADTFDISSTPARGTVVLARIRAQRKPATPSRSMDVAGVSIAKSGEPVCGDAWDVRYVSDGISVLLIDGLGHGLAAAEAARAAVTAFCERKYTDPVHALQAIHGAIRHTRGAAGAIAEIRLESATMRYTGVGNIASAVCRDGTVRQAVSHNGTLGHDARLFREYKYPWADDALFVMHSDGLSSHWSLDAYRGIARRHPALIAALLYRDFSRGRDDVTVLVARKAG